MTSVPDTVLLGGLLVLLGALVQSIWVAGFLLRAFRR